MFCPLDYFARSNHMIYADNKMLVLHLALNLQHGYSFSFEVPLGMGGGGN